MHKLEAQSECKEKTRKQKEKHKQKNCMGARSQQFQVVKIYVIIYNGNNPIVAMFVPLPLVSSPTTVSTLHISLYSYI